VPADDRPVPREHGALAAVAESAAQLTGRVVFRLLGVAARVRGTSTEAAPSTWSPVPPDTDPYETY
jgi:hypothetical protein